ncbi:signal recognition particle-docking protein FtsY [Spirochaeta lutea]|uniref:signal recognition particle-docking protein FtsY n=1 Tax=Spirochaeta lutea TaxID=1480694 RepID=UPI0009DCD22B|nr:signal recognition particle-docking protein FtsY [Spirochaeta lutea]
MFGFGKKERTQKAQNAEESPNPRARTSQRSRGSLFAKLFSLGPDTEQFYEDLEDMLIEADLGPRFAAELVDELSGLAKKQRLKNEDDLRSALVELLRGSVKTDGLSPESGSLNCFLVLGVNGVGKTTSIAKLAHFYKSRGYDKGIVLAAGDTFRAAAVEQLQTHGERLGVRCVRQNTGSDSGAVIFDGLNSAASRGEELVIADTAGRLHNKAHLVKELQKVDKIVRSKVEAGNYKKILVIDATTGQNGLQQAQVFHEALGIDGIILSKYDSTAKGGLAVSISRQLGIPFLFLGTGERYDDFHVFNPDQFIQDLVERIG